MLANITDNIDDFCDDYISYTINKFIKAMINSNIVVCKSHKKFNKNDFGEIKVCFPDLAVFITKPPLITSIDNYVSDLESYIKKFSHEPPVRGHWDNRHSYSSIIKHSFALQH